MMFTPVPIWPSFLKDYIKNIWLPLFATFVSLFSEEKSYGLNY
jgi:hypothetical protein